MCLSTSRDRGSGRTVSTVLEAGEGASRCVHSVRKILTEDLEVSTYEWRGLAPRREHTERRPLVDVTPIGRFRCQRDAGKRGIASAEVARLAEIGISNR